MSPTDLITEPWIACLAFAAVWLLLCTAVLAWLDWRDYRAEMRLLDAVVARVTAVMGLREDAEVPR